MTVPSVLEGILALAPGLRAEHDTSSLRTVTVGGGRLPAALASRFMDEYGDILYTAYGTPQLPWTTIAGPTDLRRAPDSAGRPPRNTTVRVVDDSGAPLRAGLTGRILAGHHAVTALGSGPDPDSLDALTATGELGHLDDHGRLCIEQPAE